MRDLKGKNAIVTGGSKGIGKSVCLTLANAGANVYILDIDKYEGLKTVKEVSELGVKSDFYQINVANEIEWIDFSNVLKNKNILVDILVNNPGITSDSMFHKMSREQWGNVIDINLNGLFNMTHPVWDGMRSREFGRIVNISSINGQKGQLGQANYSAAKAGELGFTKSLALEGARKGITVNSICPGYINTDMVKAMSQKAIEATESQIPVGHLVSLMI